MAIVFYFTSMCNHIIIKAYPSFKGAKTTPNEQGTKLADFSAQKKTKPDNHSGKTRIQ